MQIRTSRPALARRNLRLIYLGRVLSPTLTLVPYLTQQRDRARALDPPAAGGASKADEDHVEDVVWLQCAVGLELGEGEEETERSEAVSRCSRSVQPVDAKTEVFFLIYAARSTARCLCAALTCFEQRPASLRTMCGRCAGSFIARGTSTSSVR